MTIPVTLYCWVFVGPPDDTDSVALVGLMLSEVNPEIVCPLAWTGRAGGGLEVRRVEGAAESGDGDGDARQSIGS